MADIEPVQEVGVDQRSETVTTQQPGYAQTEQVTRDVAAERRIGWIQISGIITTLLLILEILLGIRFVLHLIAANPASGFAAFIYGVTGLFVAPFVGLVGTPASGGNIFEITTLIAMAVYALFFYVVIRVVRIAAVSASARTVTRSTRSASAAGDEPVSPPTRHH